MGSAIVKMILGHYLENLLPIFFSDLITLMNSLTTRYKRV